MDPKRLVAATLVAGLSVFMAAEPATSGADATTTTTRLVSIPYSRFALANGLTVLLHEDHGQPLVTVNINVNVGSRDERSGRTGFAHLFEHLMFMGTVRVPEKQFDRWTEAEGGWNNAWTSEDRTDYFDVGPSHLLPLLLWMEADRLGVLGQQLTGDKLDTQRDVVRNERRQQVENEPYARAELVLPKMLFPPGHPYHHPVIGSHEDLEAAAVPDAQAFFAEHYVPARMSLVIAGDFDPASVKPLVERYFGSIAVGKSGGPRRVPAAPARLERVVRETIEDNVTLPKVIMAWLSPAAYAPGDAELDLLAQILGAGKGSRLYQPLVYERKLAQTVSAYQSSRLLQSEFVIEAVARPGVSLDELEQAIDDVLAGVRAAPVSAAELVRAKNSYETGFVSRMQALATRASLLNGYLASRGDPGYAAADLQRYLAATPAGLQAVAESTLTPTARAILRIVPGAKEATDGAAGQP